MYDYADDTMALWRDVEKCSGSVISMLILHLCLFRFEGNFNLAKVLTQDISVADKNISFVDSTLFCIVHR